jgi:hypothetical protein
MCEAGLAAQLNQENCVELLSLAHTHQGGAHLKRVTLAFIKEQSHEILGGGFFAHTHQGGTHLKRVALSFIKGQSHEILGGIFGAHASGRRASLCLSSRDSRMRFFGGDFLCTLTRAGRTSSA